MKRKPIASNASIFSNGVGGQIIRFGALIGALSLGMGAWYYFTGHKDWQTVMFTTLAFAQVWQAIGIRSGNDSIFKVGLLSNKPLLGLALAVTFAQLAAIYVPALQDYLKTTALTMPDLFLSIGVGGLVLVYAEIEKLFAKGSA